MHFYLQVSSTTFLLQLILAIFPAFQHQLLFIFLPEQTVNGEAAENFPTLRQLPCVPLPPVGEMQVDRDGKEKFEVEWTRVLVINNTGMKGPRANVYT